MLRRLLIAVALIVATAAPAFAQVTLNANTTSEASGSGITQLDLTTLTVAAGSNRCLLATLLLDTANDTPTLTWDNGGTNQSMTSIGSIATGSGAVHFFGRIAPTTGNLTLRASWATSQGAMLHALAFNGCDQTGGTTTFAHFTSDTQSSATPTIVITSAANNFTVGVAVSSNDPTTPTQTENFFNDLIGFSSDGSRAAGAATVTHQWSLTSTTWETIGVDIVAAAGGGGGPTCRADLLLHGAGGC